MKLNTNPFAILGATPLDDSRTLINKAEEEMLMSDDPIEESLSTLTHMTKRMEAEISWFPDTDPKAVEQLLKTLELLKSGKEPVLPSLDDFTTPIAKANAVAEIIDCWLDRYPQMNSAVSLSLYCAMQGTDYENTMSAINKDREKAGFPLITDEETVKSALDAHIRELMTIVLASFGNDQKIMTYRNRLTEMVSRGKKIPYDSNSMFHQYLLDDYSLRVHDQYEELKKQILQQIEKENTNLCTSFSKLQNITEEWCKLLHPLRERTAVQAEARQIAIGIRQCIIHYINESPYETIIKTKKVAVFNGTKTITITFKSKVKALQNGTAWLQWAKSNFLYLEDVKTLLENDEKSARKIVSEELAHQQSVYDNAR